MELTDTDTNKLRSIIETAQILGKQNDYEEVLRLVVEKASGLVNADASLIMMINPTTRTTIKTLFAGYSTDENHHFLHTIVSGWVLVNNSSFLTENIKADKRFTKDIFQKLTVCSIICIPLRIENTIIGTILLLKNEGSSAFSEDDLHIIEAFAAVGSPFLHSTEQVAQYFTSQLPRQVLLNKYAAFGLLGKSKKFIELLHAIEAAARCDVRILLEGESGTGKELAARAIHKLSSRSEKKFIAVDCGAIQPNLVESELFGHVRGAFTGALHDRRGLFEEANGGTLFMDEVNNLPFDIQSKLLRVLQDEQIRPVGSNNVHKVNVRVITASSLSLKKLVSEKVFRQDLFYRLSVYPISLPSLNERTEDIPMLAYSFLRKFSSEQNKEIEGFHEEILDYMKQRRWSGNVRELENFVHRLVTLVMKKQKIIDRKILPHDYLKELEKLRKDYLSIPITKSLNESLAECEEQIIRTALVKCNWNQSKAARMLQISEHSVRYKMERLNISPPPETPPLAD